MTQRGDSSGLVCAVVGQELQPEVFGDDARQFFCHSAALVSNLPVQQGDRTDPDLIECLRLAEALRLAAFVADSMSPEAAISGGTSALGALVGKTAGELVGLRLGQLLKSSAVTLAPCDLDEAELCHADGRGVPVLLRIQQLRGEPALWFGLAFARQASGRGVAALARQLVHEVSNPLTSVVCRLELVGRQLPQLVSDRDRGEDLAGHLATAQDGTERVIALIREFADSLDRTPEAPEHTLPGTLPPSSHRRSKRA